MPIVPFSAIKVREAFYPDPGSLGRGVVNWWAT